MEITKPLKTISPDAHYIENDEARELFNKAYAEQIMGNYELAIALYMKSIEAYPSAQATTYLGWTHALMQDFEKAIDICKVAIEIDPDYGNPYNDIGAYLVELGQDDEAIHWLKEAIIAKKYDAKFFPYFNLGRIYKKKNMIKKAVECFKKALDYKVDFKPAQKEYEELRNSLN